MIEIEFGQSSNFQNVQIVNLFNHYRMHHKYPICNVARDQITIEIYDSTNYINWSPYTRPTHSVTGFYIITLFVYN